jgi:hypothetical protein
VDLVAVGPLGALAAGAVAERYGVRTGMACIATGAAALLAWVLTFTSLRTERQ